MIYLRNPRFSFRIPTVRILICLNLVLGFLSMGGFLYAQGSDLIFHRISIEDGLSQSLVNCAIQDNRGLMWFGTQDGLNKYDGYRFTIYNLDLADSTSLSDKHIRSLYEDKSGTLWIGTWIGGLNRFDRATDSFTSYTNDPQNPNSLSHNFVQCILEDKSGALWLGTLGGGLNQFDRTSNRFTSFQNDPDNPNSLSHNEVLSIYEDHLGFLWIGTDGGGLNQFDPASLNFIHYQNDSDNPNSLSHNVVRAICEDQQGNLWIGTDSGLNRFDRNTKSFTCYNNNLNDPNSLSHNSVTSLYIDRSGRFWIGTDGGGLNKFDAVTKTFTHYQNDPHDLNSLGSNSILSIYEDRSGVIWVCTWRGINWLASISKAFSCFRNDPYNSNSLSMNDVWALYEDSDEAGKALWIGTLGGGLNRFDRMTQRFAHFTHDPQNPNSLSDNRVYSIVKDHLGNYWIGTGQGLDKLVLKPSPGQTLNHDNPGDEFDHTQTHFIHYKHDPKDPTSISAGHVNVIFEDKQGTLWIGTEGGGLNRFERTTNQFTRHLKDPYDSNSLSDNRVRSVYEDHLDVLWIGTLGGLNRFDHATKHFTRYFHDPKEQLSICSNKVLSICEDRSNNLWIGTADGLNRYNRATDQFVSFTIKDGLPNNVIYAIVEDNNGSIWMSTNRGLSQFNPLTKQFKNYDETDGLQSNEFNAGSCFKSRRSGEIFFGGINGFNVINPDAKKGNTYIPPVIITDFQIFNKSIPIGEGFNGRIILKKSITETKEIELSYADQVFSFEFAALNYIFPEKNKYAYMMENFEKEWNVIGNRRFATYTNLHPGNYVFRVKASNNDGLWNEDGTSLKITISPPFWKTWWFRIWIFSCLALIAGGVYRMRVRSINERAKELEVRVRDRTAELKKINQKLGKEVTVRKRAEEEAHRRAVQATLIYQAGQRLSSELKLDTLISEITEAIQEAFNYYAVMLFLVDEDGQHIRQKSIVSNDRNIFAESLCLPIGKGMTGYAAQSGQIQISGCVENNPHYIGEDNGQTRSEIAVPIKRGQHVIGVLDIQSDQYDTFDAVDVSAMETLSTQIASAIENARLYEQSQQEIADRKQAEEDLEQAMEAYRRSNDELQQFTYAASHDLQEPLRKIKAFGERLEAKCGDDLSEQGRDYLNRMQNAANRMNNLIQALLQYSRVTTKAKPFETVDLNTIARDVLSDLEIRIEEAGATVAVDPLPEVEADPTQMRQLLQNLIANALKYRKPDVPPEVHVSARVVPSEYKKTDLCELSVADNGIGIDPKYHERIFGIFQRLHGRNEIEGSGVGLSVCKKIVERHGGTITVQSTSGEGSTFIARLPCTSST